MNSTNTSKIANILVTVSKVFLIGLLLQFFLQTFVTYKLGWSNTFLNILWGWKEIIIVGLFGFSMYRLWTTKLWKTLFDRLGLKWFVICTLGLTIFILLISIFFTGVGVGPALISLRYSITWFVIFVIFALLAWIFFDEHIQLEKRYTKIISWLLWGCMFRWLIISLLPRLLEFAGYNQYNYEGDIGVAPPAVYHAQYNQGYARNQFLFERPISWGFFLVAFWPLFFALFLKQRGWKKMATRGTLYALSVLSTFSRAAWIAWMLQIWILILVEYRKNLKHILLYGGLPVVLLFGTVTYLGRDQIIERQFSNTWHLRMIQEAFQKIGDKPRFGQWAGSAWPASHHLGKGKEYNPENQFLQIWIEYGLFWFLAWIALYGRLHRIGIKALINIKENKATKQQRYIWFLLFCFSLGIAGLSICWFVLHSFVDRMIVYPFMALFGIMYAMYKKTMTLGEKI